MTNTNPTTEDVATDPKSITVVTVQHGYNHTVYGGICGPEVTLDDIKERFYHPHFGGRQAWVEDGNWGATCHDD